MALNRAQRRLRDLPHDVYKAYDLGGRLLYVGISVNVFRRLRQHKTEHSRWLPHIDRIDVTQYSNRNAARAEEARCIREDAPAFNVTNESAWGCVLDDEIRESFTMREDEQGWYIDG